MNISFYRKPTDVTAVYIIFPGNKFVNALGSTRAALHSSKRTKQTRASISTSIIDEFFDFLDESTGNLSKQLSRGIVDRTGRYAILKHSDDRRNLRRSRFCFSSSENVLIRRLYVRIRQTLRFSGENCRKLFD